MPSEKTVRSALRGRFDLVRWAVLGTAAAVGFGVVLGLLIGLPKGSIDVAIGGAAFGLAGGPVFGVVIGRMRREWGVRSHALAGAVVFGLVPLVIGLVRHGEVLGPQDRLSEVVSGLLFMVGAGAIFGAIFSLMFGGRSAKSQKPHRNGWTELEL